MANLSLREAVKHFDVSRPTLQKALKSGKVSGVQDGKGQWTIDPSELARVYQPRQADVAKAGNTDPDNLSGENTPLAGEIQALRLQLADAERRAGVAEAEKRTAEALAEERGRHIEDLRRLLPAPKQHDKKAWQFWKS